MLVVDVSNYTAVPTPEQLQSWKDAGVGAVIVQAIDPPAGYPGGVTVEQINAVNAAGLQAEAYVWLWTESDVAADIARKLSLLEGLPVSRVWLDVEDTTDASVEQRIQTVRDALGVLDAWTEARGLPRAGIYTARWFWPRYMSDTTEFSDRELWDADYDDVADVESGWEPYGGWTSRRVKQYAGTSTLEGVEMVDLNVVADDYVAPEAPEAAPEPPARETPEDWPWPTWYEAAVNYKGIADQLGQAGSDEAALKARVGALESGLASLRDAVDALLAGGGV